VVEELDVQVRAQRRRCVSSIDVERLRPSGACAPELVRADAREEPCNGCTGREVVRRRQDRLVAVYLELDVVRDRESGEPEAERPGTAASSGRASTDADGARPLSRS